MPRKYFDYRPNAAVIRSAGGLGAGIAQAGKMLGDYGNNKWQQQYKDKAFNEDARQFDTTDRYRNKKFDEDVRQFDTTDAFRKQSHRNNMGLGYFRVNSANSRHADTMGIRNKEYDQRVKEHEWRSAQPDYRPVTTADGVYAVDMRNPVQKTRLGDPRASSSTLPSYKVATTDEGVYMVNPYNPNEKVKIGDPKTSKMTPYQQQKMYFDTLGQLKASMDGFDELPANQQDYLVTEFMSGNRNHQIKGTGWWDGDPRVEGYTPPKQQEADNARMQMLQEMLRQQNELLSKGQ